MSNQYFSNPQKKISQWKYECLAIRCALFGMIFCDVLERFSEVTFWITWWLFLLKLKDQPTYPMLRNLKESHQKPIIFHHKKFPPTSPNLEPVASFRSPCIPGFNRLQVKGRPRLKSMPKGLASWTNETTSWRVNKKWAHSKTFPKYPWNIHPDPQPSQFVKVFFSLLKLWGCRPAFFGVCWRFLGATLRACFVMKQNAWFYIDFCVEMTALICNLKKAACKQVLQASTEIALIYDDILCTRISTFVDAFPWYFNCSGWRMKSHALYIKGTQGHPEIWRSFIHANPCFFILKDCQYHVNAPIQYNTTWYNTTSKDLFCSQLINKTVRSRTYQWFGLIIFFIRRTNHQKQTLHTEALSRKNPLLFLKTHG